MQGNRKDNSIIKDRILQYLDFKGISKYKFYKEANVTSGILSQLNGIAEDNLLKFCFYAPDISIEWLLLGKGEMIKSYESIDLKDKRKAVVYEKQSDYNSEITLLRNDYIKTANKLIQALEENARLKERLQKYEGADQ